MFPLYFIALFLLFAAIILLLYSQRQRRESGLPSGRVIYSDTRGWKKPDKPLFDAALGLTGKPDYIVEQNGMYLPVEVKSCMAPPLPYESHIYQLLAYCMLVERICGTRPTHGILHYRNRTFAIDFSPEAEEKVLDIMADMRKSEGRGGPQRSHEFPARCGGCGYRSICDQRL